MSLARLPVDDAHPMSALAGFAPAASASRVSPTDHGGVSASRLSRLVGLFVTVSPVLGWAGVVAHLVLQRDESISTALRQNPKLARALEEQTLRALAITDHATIRMRDAVVARGSVTPDEMVRLANETGGRRRSSRSCPSSMREAASSAATSTPTARSPATPTSPSASTCACT